LNRVPMRLLLIEDDAMIGESVEESLRAENHAVDWVRDGKKAELALAHPVYDLILLDLGLPGRHGLDLLRGYRSKGGKLPVLIITARDAPAARVTGLDAGADDYLVKPFDLDELHARVRALLRRQGGHGSPTFVSGAVSLDPARREVTLRGEPLHLSSREFAVLLALLHSAGDVVSKSRLEETLYGWNQEVESNTVEVYIHQLRKKLGGDFIRTVRGIGYKFVAET
jgi:two-component system OmpR family response regulator/two-component system response regulator QseB